MVDRRTAAERVRERIKEAVDTRPRGIKVLIAEKLGVTPSTLTPYVDGSATPDLDKLEGIARALDLRLSELVAADGSAIYELDADEARIVRALRAWPASVRHALCAFVDFFANEEPTAGQTRKLFELWRHLDGRTRLAVYGFAVDKSEGMIPPELEARLFEELSAEAKAAVGKPPKLPKRRRNAEKT